MTNERTAWGWGLASIDAAGNTLDVWYPQLTLGAAPEGANRPNHEFGALAQPQADARGVRREPVFTVSSLDDPIADAADAYLRLHLLSMRLAQPNTLNLDGIFAKLTNVVWTNYGPFAVEDFNARKLDVEAAATSAARSFAASAGLPAAAPAATVNVLSIDKFPRMIDYVVPSGVRIGDADRVRLGAHLSEGTTVMHAGFVNFNAGTLGVSMVEGRVSQGVVVGNGSDIGGGASAAVMAESLEIVLSDPQVESVFINVYGGITSCVEVANGILEAVAKLGGSKPIVVRFDGNAAAEGLHILASANNPNIHVSETMEGAAAKAPQLAGEPTQSKEVR